MRFGHQNPGNYKVIFGTKYNLFSIFEDKINVLCLLLITLAHASPYIKLSLGVTKKQKQKQKMINGKNKRQLNEKLS
jgi:hypothetical protein